MDGVTELLEAVAIVCRPEATRVSADDRGGRKVIAERVTAPWSRVIELLKKLATRRTSWAAGRFCAGPSHC